MAKKKIIEKPTCCFEWYDKNTKSMKACGKVAVLFYRDNPLCAECASYIDKSNTAVRLIK